MRWAFVFARIDLRQNCLLAKLFPQKSRIVGVPKGTFPAAMIYLRQESWPQVRFHGQSSFDAEYADTKDP
jgi:hypothetical protein